MRTLVVGDIHSGARALEQLLTKAKITPKDHIIFLGDYVDGWSTAVETVDFLIQLQSEYHCTFIRGNHDELCRAWLVDQNENPQWLAHGGTATRNSYLNADRDKWDEHIKFYKSLKNYHLENDNRLYLHAGYTNLK